MSPGSQSNTFFGQHVSGYLEGAFLVRLGGDADGDGTSNRLDNCPDDHNPTQADYDQDGVGDECDADDDDDGIEDVEDMVCPFSVSPSFVSPSSLNDHDGDGCEDDTEDIDDDNDGFSDAVESIFKDALVDTPTGQLEMHRLTGTPMAVMMCLRMTMMMVMGSWIRVMIAAQAVQASCFPCKVGATTMAMVVMTVKMMTSTMMVC